MIYCSGCTCKVWALACGPECGAAGRLLKQIPERENCYDLDVLLSGDRQSWRW